MGALALVQLAAGIAMVMAAWLLPRRIADAPLRLGPALLLDLAPFVLGACLLGLGAGRPLFTGIIVLALGAGFALADQTMRQTLREPVVFSEMSELPQVFTHPHLYLPFAGPGLVIGGAAAAVAGAVVLLLIEPPLWTAHPVAMLVAAALIAGAGWLTAREPLLGATAAALRRLGPSGEPFADAAALGPFGMLIAHTIIARAERPRRQSALALHQQMHRRCSPGRPAAGMTEDPDVPVILVQCESFFDARRLSPLIPSELLAGYEQCCAASALYGRLEVPAWGANTMRAEFAVLSGVPESELGYDRFNPYYALARVPLESQVWRLRRAGYRTICLHPFDRRFFRRDLAMPALGFEQFLGRETLGGARRPPYCPDCELAEHILRLLDSAGPRTFIFAITMANHGPWLAKEPPVDPALAGLFDRQEVADAAGLLRYLDGLRQSDQMLQRLIAGLEQRGGPAILGFYGDHVPSLGGPFRSFGFDEAQSDYVIWPGILPGIWPAQAAPQRRDLPAHQLGRLIVDAVLGEAALGEAALTGPAVAATALDPGGGLVSGRAANVLQ